MQIYFAIPPNSAFHGLLEEFFFLYQRYKISNTLAINLLGNAQHFRTVPKLLNDNNFNYLYNPGENGEFKIINKNETSRLVSWTMVAGDEKSRVWA